MRNKFSMFSGVLAVMILCGLLAPAQAQKPYRVGTTAANFLEIGYGPAGSAMGDAYVAMAQDLSALYWNPAGLAYMEQNEAQFLYQPWVAGINTAFAGVGLVLPGVGTLTLGIYHTGYGDIEVTTLRSQEGTGELYTASDFSFNLAFSRRLAQWFAFGAAAKFITSQIWHMNANAVALDLGVMVNTSFFSFTGERADGMTIAMSISNYGTRMKYGGIDLTNPIDILPDEAGNFRDVPGQFRLNSWELPLIFRLGVAVHPLVRNNSRLTIAADALHPNNNSESLNLGAQYQIKIPSAGTFYFRGGYKALFMQPLFSDESEKFGSEYGFAAGAGMVLRMMGNVALKVDYAYRGVGVLGKVHSYSFGIMF